MIPTLAVMVAVIGSVVALYILVRCCQVVESGAGGGTKFFAIVTAAASFASIIVLVVLALDVVQSGTDLGSELDRLGR